MFSIIYVLLPFSDQAPAEAIRTSLASFERGGRGDIPEERLAFHDETWHMRSLHEREFVFTQEDNGATRIEGGDVTYLNLVAVQAEMARRGLRRWAVRFADVEPDVGAFAAQYVRDLERHPASGGYGLWLNPQGRWDWWDLGGRFDGRITGERRRPSRAVSVVSSGANRGRDVLAGVGQAIGRALGSDPAAEVVVEADNNIEMVSRLLEDAKAGREHAIPGAILLPPASIEDRLRWVRSWPEVGPAETAAWLGLPADAAVWEEIVIAAYSRFRDHWAAGVAFHL